MGRTILRRQALDEGERSDATAEIGWSNRLDGVFQIFVDVLCCRGREDVPIGSDQLPHLFHGDQPRISAGILQVQTLQFAFESIQLLVDQHRQ